MTEKDSNNVEKHFKKWSNPLKRMLGGAKKIVKKEENESEEPSFPERDKKSRGKEPEKAKAQKVETPEAEENEKKQSKKAKSKEQKLPKKYRKGW